MTISIEGPLGTKDVFGCPDIGYLHPLMRIISNRRPFGSPHLLASGIKNTVASWPDGCSVPCVVPCVSLSDLVDGISAHAGNQILSQVFFFLHLLIQANQTSTLSEIGFRAAY